MYQSIQQPVKLIRLPQVLEMTGLARSTLYAKVVEGTFPRPVKLGERSVAWIEGDVQQWIRSRCA